MEGGYSLKSQQGQKHALVLSVILQAHFAGILRLATKLAQSGVAITFVGLKKQIELLKTFEEFQEVDFNLISYEDSGLAGSSGEILTIHVFLARVRSLFEPIFHRLMEDKKAGLPGPTCIIGDRFLTWATDIAKKLNIPYYQFFSCGATFVRSLQACSQLIADGTLTVKEGTGGLRLLAEFEGLLKIPGLPPLQSQEMTNSSLGTDFTNSLGKHVQEADGVIANTFYDLEPRQIDAIRQNWIDSSPGKVHRLFLVGPLSNASTFRDRSFLANSVKGGTDCLQWLDRRPHNSVIYVCLGSIVRFTPQQVRELAWALEASDQSFVWATPNGSQEGLPPNFEEQTREKGLVVSGWVPQLQILGHPSIGGFVTHCGWNSIIESILSGVPMAAWPQLRNDQFINCRYIVDVLKIAVEVRPGQASDYSARAATISTSDECTEEHFIQEIKMRREEFGRAVRLLMSEEGNAMRLRVQELKKAAEAAVADGGVSKKALHDLVQNIPP